MTGCFTVRTPRRSGQRMVKSIMYGSGVAQMLSSSSRSRCKSRSKCCGVLPWFPIAARALMDSLAAGPYSATCDAALFCTDDALTSPAMWSNQSFEAAGEERRSKRRGRTPRRGELTTISEQANYTHCEPHAVRKRRLPPWRRSSAPSSSRGYRPAC